MPRLRGSILPEKRRTNSFFGKFRKHNQPPSPSNVEVDNHGSDPMPIRAVPEFRATLGSGVSNNHRYQHQSSISKNTILKFTNTLATVYMMGENVYTVTSCWNVYYAGTGGKQTYFTPAPWSFLMWAVIHALMLGACIYQFSYQGSSILVDQVGWKLPLLQISNAMYNHYRSNQRYKYAFVFIVITYMVVNKMYQNMSKISSRGIRDQLFCRLSISLYHSWVLCLTFLAAFEAFGVDALATPAHSGTKMSIIFSFVLIQSFEWAYASPATEGDFFACLCVSWFLFAIAVEQSVARSAFVHWSAHGFTTFSLCWITKCVIGLELKDHVKVVQLEDEERGPLLGG